MISQEGDRLLGLGQLKRPVALWSSRAGYAAGYVVADFASIMLSFLLAYGLRFQTADVPDELTQPFSAYLPLASLTAVASLLFFGLGRLYDHPRQMSMGQQLYGIFSGTS